MAEGELRKKLGQLLYLKNLEKVKYSHVEERSGGRELDLRSKGRWFEAHRRLCVVLEQDTLSTA